ncbi:MAG: hypothetical protein FWD75_05020 [Propionibacteriaceae bacterium]|nr:hypothetical protein [Propionibacteriaceae bacterium]
MNLMTAGGRVLALFKRDIHVFVRNPTALLFAVASPLVLAVLVPMFFRGEAAGVISGILPDAGMGDVHALGAAWACSTVAILSLFSSSAAVLIVFLADRREDRIDVHRVSGTAWWELVCGYLLTSVLVSFAISFLVVLLGELGGAMAGHPVMSFVVWLRVILGILLAAVFFTALNALAITFVFSPGIFGAHCFAMGVATGFLTFSLSFTHGLGLLRLLPFAQAASVIREPMLIPALNRLDPGASLDLTYALGAVVRWGATTWYAVVVVIVLLLWSAITMALAFWRMGRVLADR